MRNAMTLRGVLTAQVNFKAHGGGTLGQPHGLFNFPALVRTPLADLLAYVLRCCCRPPVAAARCAASLVPFTAPLHLRPMSVAAGAGVLSPFAPARGILSFVCIPFQDSPRYGDLPVAKTNNPASVQLFAIADSLLSVQSTNGLPIS